ncbi:T6SS effector BTH_I2691 family protein [Morganella psychrotolerans]|uniref:T6SS effector BTH_I2691 family protein n=1 Tax=Morganella psychrotolerans TaxID=368603 RepID=UPI0039AEED58
MHIDKDCSFCRREGLPVIPVRPAIMEKESSLPVNKGEIVCSIPPEGEVSYTRRLLREGFLYIYDELGHCWINYYVTADGFYYPLSQDSDVPEAVVKGERKPCIIEPESLAKASFITLPVLPESVGVNGSFWFSWAEVQWTKSTRAKHEEPNYRKRYMQLFDLGKWLKTKSEKLAISVDRLMYEVAECSAFSHNSNIAEYTESHWLNKNGQQYRAIKEQCELLYPGHGVILELSDPVGIIKDIASLCNYRYQVNLLENKEFVRERNLSSVLDMLTDGVKNQYEFDYLATIENVRGKVENKSNSAFKEASDYYLEKHTTPYMSDIVDYRWSKYEKYIDREKQASFEERYKKAVSDYNNTIISPMVKMYLIWFSCENFTDYMEHNFDQDNVVSGSLFLQTIADCLEGMQDKIGVSKLIQKSLLSEKYTSDNLILRALMLNQNNTIDIVSGAVSSAGNYDDLPWDKVIEGVGGVVESHLFVIQLAMEKLSNTISSGIVGLIDNALNKAPLPALVWLSAFYKKRVTLIEVYGTKYNFVKVAAEKTLEMLNVADKSTRRQLSQHIDNKIKILGMKGVKISGNTRLRFLVAIDHRDVPRLYGYLQNKQLKNIADSLTPVENLRNIMFSDTWRSDVNASINTKASALLNNSMRSIPFAGIVLSTAFQINVVMGSFKKATKGELKDNEEWMKFIANTMTAFGAVLITLEKAIYEYKVLRIIPKININYNSRVMLKIRDRLLRGARFFSAFGLIIVFWDGYHSFEEVQKGNYGLASLYFISGVSGGVIWGMTMSRSVANFFLQQTLFRCAIGVYILPLMIVILFMSMFLIAYLEEDKLEAWFKRIYFRKDMELGSSGCNINIWPTMDFEMSELNKALGYEGEE